MRRLSTGFTLVEVVIALSILAIAFFGMISVVTYTSRMNQSTKERNLAMRAAERKLEQMLAYTDWANIYNNFSDNSVPVPGNVHGGEGKGWEQVLEMDKDGNSHPALMAFPITSATVTKNHIQVPGTLPDLVMETGYTYPAPPPPGMARMSGDPGEPWQAVLFVRFPLKSLGVFSEQGAGRFMGLTNDDLDLDADGAITSKNLTVDDCKILPVNIEVYWKSAVGDRKTPGYLSYKYIFLKKAT